MSRPPNKTGEDLGDFAVASDEETKRFVKSALSAAEKVAQRRSLELGEEIIEETGEMCTGCCGPIVRKIKVKSDGSTCEETVECKSCGTLFHHGPVNCPD